MLAQSMTLIIKQFGVVPREIKNRRPWRATALSAQAAFLYAPGQQGAVVSKSHIYRPLATGGIWLMPDFSTTSHDNARGG